MISTGLFVAGLERLGAADRVGATAPTGEVTLGILDVGARRLPNASHTVRFLSQRAEDLIARLPDDDDLRSLTLPARREARRELDSLLSQIARQRAAVAASRPALELDALDAFFATLEDQRELVLFG